MKETLLFLLLISFQNCLSQEKFSHEVQNVSDNIVKQITGASAKAKLGKDTASYKVAIVSIENEDKNSSKLTELLENKIAINLAMQSNGRYDILDRNYIEKLMNEKNIPLQYNNKRDFARNLGRIKAANFIVVGTLSTFENDFELNLQVIETTEGNTIGGATGTITATQLLKEKNGQTKDIGYNTTFPPQSSQPQNTPIENKTPPATIPTSAETYNNNPVNQDCQKYNTGDYCFLNSTQNQVTVNVRYYTPFNERSITENHTKITLPTGVTKCVYGVVNSKFSSNHYVVSTPHPVHISVDIDEGDFSVEKCKSKTYSITGVYKE